MNEYHKTKLKLQELENLVNCGGFKFTENQQVPWFDYTSCYIGPYYVQSMDVFKSKSTRNSAVISMEYYISNFIDNKFTRNSIISCGESRDWPFGIILADNMNWDVKILYKDGKTSFGIPDEQLKDNNILHIADLNNEGSSIKKWDAMIKAAGAKISDVLFYVDRMEDGVSVCKELGINRHAIIELDGECWKYLLKKKVISRPMFEDLISYWKDRKTWGCKKILEHPEQLVKLIRDEKKHQRGIGIFKTYNDLTNGELAKRLDIIDSETLINQ